MSIKVTYANLASAKRGMRKRGITYRENCAPHRATNPTGIHFGLDTAHVVRRIDTPVVAVEYYYFNSSDEPKRARVAA